VFSYRNHLEHLGSLKTFQEALNYQWHLTQGC